MFMIFICLKAKIGLHIGFGLYVSGSMCNKPYWAILYAFLSSADFSESTFLKNSFRNAIRVSNSLNRDQAPFFVGPDFGPNCLQRLQADNTSRQIIKVGHNV